jgi:hypothetical protein
MRTAVLALLICLLAAAPAGAAWFPADAIDGPSPDVLALGDIDMARDGSGGMTYVKREGGVPHVFLARFRGGGWRPPERVDVGLDAPASQPVVAAADDNRIAVAWISGGKLYGAFFPGGSPAPLTSPQLLLDPGAGAVSDPHIDMGINGTAYVVCTAPGAGGSDVRAIRLFQSTWEQVGAPLDIGPDQSAGTGAGRPRIAVSAEGNAVAVWGESHPDGRPRVYGRRITGLNLSVAPQEVSLPEFEGGAGRAADSPDIDIEDDGSYAWVVFRQSFGGSGTADPGRSRAIARRLVGSLFDPPVAIDGGAAAETPRVSINGRGVGIATAATDAHAVQAALLERDAFMPSLRIDAAGSSASPLPVGATSEREDSGVAWRATAPSGATAVIGRYRPNGAAYDPEQLISVPDYGPAAPTGLEIAEDRIGNMGVAFLQGPPDARRIVVASWDRPPGAPLPLSSASVQRRSRPRLKWRPGAEQGGAQTFRVLIDGAEVGRTTSSFLVVPGNVSDGVHRWQVIAVDRRGQETPSKSRLVRIDATPPEVRIKVSGKRKAGQTLKISVLAKDAGGVASVQIDFGDRSRKVLATRAAHRYRAGRFFIKARVVDKVGNVTVQNFRLRVKK